MNAMEIAWVTFGRALFRGLAASACVIAIVAVILFAPQGIRAVDAVRMLDGSVGACALVWCIWFSLAVPPIADALRAPGTTLVRSFPLREGRLAAAVFAIVGMTQLPWAALYFRGGSPMRGVTTLAISVACSAALVGRWRTRLAFPAALALVFVPWAIALPLACVTCCFAAFDAWRYAADPRPAFSMPLPRFAPIALAAVLVLFMLRIERTRMFLVLGLAVGARLLAARLDADAFSRPVTLLALVGSFCASIVAPPIVREAARLRWIVPRAWLPLACAAAVLFVASSVYAWWSGVIAVVQIGIAERARVRSWSGTLFGILAIASAAVFTLIASRLA